MILLDECVMWYDSCTEYNKPATMVNAHNIPGVLNGNIVPSYILQNMHHFKSPQTCGYFLTKISVMNHFLLINVGF